MNEKPVFSEHRAGTRSYRAETRLDGFCIVDRSGADCTPPGSRLELLMAAPKNRETAIILEIRFVEIA